MPENIARRKLKVWERGMLWARSKGLCSVCGNKLEQGWHADHIDPFVKTGRTNVWEMQALCPDCNLKKGKKTMRTLNTQNNSITNSEFDLSGFRNSQRKLFLRTKEAIQSGETKIGIHLHIRGGKTMFMRSISKWCVDAEYACVAMIINNRAELRKQCADPKEFGEDCRRLGVEVGREFPAYNMVKTAKRNGEVIELDGHFPELPWQNNEYILSTSIQTLIGNKERLITWIESVQKPPSQPVIVFVDEAQEFGTDDLEGNMPWEGVVELLTKMGCILVSLSGFPHREDGKTIPCFIKKNSETSSTTKTVLGSKIKDIDENIALFETEKRDIDTEMFDLEPIGGNGFSFPLSVGFDTGSLCKIYENHITRKVTLLENGEVIIDNMSMSELSKSDAKRNLRRYVMHDDVIRDACENVIDAIYEKRAADPNIKAMIFSCSDEDGKSGTDEHASLIEKKLNDMSSLKTVVVTGSSSKNVPASQLLIEFKNDDNDIIILKNVGRVGFDCPKAKVLCDLSDIRAQGKTVQTWLRVSTPYNSIPALVIHPNDHMARNHFDAAIGIHMDRLKHNKSVVVEVGETEVESKDRMLIVGDRINSVMKDNDQLIITSEENKLVASYKQKYPAQCAYLEKITPSEVWRDFVKPYLKAGHLLDVTNIQSVPEPLNPANEIQLIRSRINTGGKNNPALINQYMIMICGGRKKHEYEKDGGDIMEWQKKRSTAIKKSKTDCGLRSKISLDDITSVAKWRELEHWWVDKIEKLGAVA